MSGSEQGRYDRIIPSSCNEVLFTFKGKSADDAKRVRDLSPLPRAKAQWLVLGNAIGVVLLPRLKAV